MKKEMIWGGLWLGESKLQEVCEMNGRVEGLDL